MRLRHIFVSLSALMALIPAAASADSDGYSCSGFGGMMGYGGAGFAVSIITTVLVWLVLALLAAYLWKRVK